LERRGRVAKEVKGRKERTAGWRRMEFRWGEEATLGEGEVVTVGEGEAEARVSVLEVEETTAVGSTSSSWPTNNISSSVY